MQYWEWFDFSYVIGLLDVLVVSYLIYRILLMVRGTRAMPMLAGLGVVVVVYAVAQEIGLVTLTWILGNFLGSVILVVVVLFQDDLRRGLTKVGLWPGIAREVDLALERTIKEVSKAASEISARRLGALMVIQRDVGLEDYSEQAVGIDSLVSAELLISIFLPTSPIHDGAIIINGDRIVGAGAVLPLTFDRTISKSLGTRHRAGLGLSERTDALIVVVSEETGIISLIREGRITRDLNEKTLFNALHRLTIVRKKQRAKSGQGSFWSKVVSNDSRKLETKAAEGQTEEPAKEQVNVEKE